MKGKLLLKGLVLLACLMMLSAPTVLAQIFCQGDFNYDGNVDAADVSVFLQNFGRSPFFNPCPPDGPAPVAETGQTTCYDENGVERICNIVIPPVIVTTGEDGAWRKGVEWPNPRFTDNRAGTITDNLTGLIWLKNSNCFGQRTWQQALDDCKGLASGSCGLTDGTGAGIWRLPNRRELFSLIHDGYYSPAVPNTVGTGQWSEGDPFNNVQSDFYWSSTSLAYQTVGAWYVYMDTGSVGDFDKSGFVYVWPVRGGQ